MCVCNKKKIAYFFEEDYFFYYLLNYVLIVYFTVLSLSKIGCTKKKIYIYNALWSYKVISIKKYYFSVAYKL